MNRCMDCDTPLAAGELTTCGHCLLAARQPTETQLLDMTGREIITRATYISRYANPTNRGVEYDLWACADKARMYAKDGDLMTARQYLRYAEDAYSKWIPLPGRVS
jgi:hypothetical protein